MLWRANESRRARRIWTQANGPIPPKHHIHHKDRNWTNNAIENLECLSAAEHESLHHKGQTSPRKRAHLEAIRPLTRVWHASKEGLEWHRQHALSQVRPTRSHVCIHCGASFESNTTRTPKFCGNNCKSAWRRESGVDNETRQCAQCGSPFLVNKYSTAVTCSNLCGGRFATLKRIRVSK